MHTHAKQRRKLLLHLYLQIYSLVIWTCTQVYKHIRSLHCFCVGNTNQGNLSASFKQLWHLEGVPVALQPFYPSCIWLEPSGLALSSSRLGSERENGVRRGLLMKLAFFLADVFSRAVFRARCSWPGEGQKTHARNQSIILSNTDLTGHCPVTNHTEKTLECINDAGYCWGLLYLPYCWK